MIAACKFRQPAVHECGKKTSKWKFQNAIAPDFAVIDDDNRRSSQYALCCIVTNADRLNHELEKKQKGEFATKHRRALCSGAVNYWRNLAGNLISITPILFPSPLRPRWHSSWRGRQQGSLPANDQSDRHLRSHSRPQVVARHAIGRSIAKCRCARVKAAKGPRVAVAGQP